MSIRPVATGVAWRMLKNVFTNPSIFLPSLLFPLFFFTAFAGGLSQVAEVPGFDFAGDYTAFQFAFVLLQSAAFGGVFTGFGIARDFDGGFARRLLLASPNRSGILVGYGVAALLTYHIAQRLHPLPYRGGRVVVLVAVALAAGVLAQARAPHGATGIAFKIALCAGFAVLAGGLALRRQPA